jgi:hypothetical protein
LSKLKKDLILLNKYIVYGIIILMTGKISVKKIFIVFFLYGVVLILCACIVPIDIQTFLDSPAVTGIIESSKTKEPTVIIHEDSDYENSLIAGNSKISGLPSDEYYRVEEYDEDMVFQGNLFVKSDGSHWGDLSEIGRLEADQIKNLKNLYTYKIKSAATFNDGTYKYFAFGDDKVREADAVGGAITIRGQKNYYINLAPIIDAGKNYEVMKIPSTTEWGNNSRTSAYYTGTAVSNIDDTKYEKYETNRLFGIYQYRTSVRFDPLNPKLNFDLQDMSILALSGINTESDYIFAEYNNGSVTNFTVLKIARRDDIKITVDVEYSSDKEPSLSVSNTSSSQTSNQNITISVTDTPNPYTLFKWYIDGVLQPTTGSSFTFSMSNVGNKQQGVYLITVVGYIGSEPYSAKAKITVTEY